MFICKTCDYASTTPDLNDKGDCKWCQKAKKEAMKVEMKRQELQKRLLKKKGGK